MPVAKTDKAELNSGVDKLKPLGNTPIAYSLEQAAKDLPRKGPRSIVLVSDGQENCRGDPCKVSGDLKKAGAEFYRVADAGTGTFHVSAASPPSSKSSTVAEVIGINVLSAAGKGPYAVQVHAPKVEGVQPLEVLLRTEPAVKSVEGLPGSSGFDHFSDDVKGDAPSSTVVPAVGGPNFSAAPPTGPGTYSDSILVNETLFYRVPDVKWGQQVVCDFTLNKAAAAGAALKGDSYRAMTTSRVFGPLKSEIRDSSARAYRDDYDGASTTTVHSASLPVRYLNRSSNQDAPRAADLDGDYYPAQPCFRNRRQDRRGSVQSDGQHGRDRVRQARLRVTPCPVRSELLGLT